MKSASCRPVQAKLLRALQEGEIQARRGGARGKGRRAHRGVHESDWPPRRRSGVFREDLYYRLAVVELVVPR